MHRLDDDPGLDDLLPPARQAQLLALLETLSGSSYALNTAPGEEAQPVEFNLSTVAWLRGGSAAQRMAAANLLELVLYFVGKYRYAANLHHDVTEANYLELARQHDALKQSEARYRALSSELQRRVDAQVAVIEKAQRDLYESARLRCVGQLAAGVAHEINNPISFIASNMGVARQYLDEIAAALPADTDPVLIEDFRALVAESKTGADRIAAIVRDLRTFSNIDKADFVVCDLNALLEAACHLARTECGETLNLTLRLGTLPPWKGFPAKLSQAFYNVLDNAVRASPPGGLIAVSSEHAGGAVVITVQDQGVGMAADVLARAFEPFFTTRDVGQGTGLGLTVARDIVQSHGGDMTLTSAPGRGCTVRMCLRPLEQGQT